MITQLFERLNPQLAIDVIDAAQRGPQLVLALKRALDSGRMVGVMADRARAGEAKIAVQFMGATALLPIGPWVLAGALGVPVILGFGIHRGGNRYESHFELLTDCVELPRSDRDKAIEGWAQRYAGRLEHYARLAPYNWFNFFDFWADESAAH
jgi:predicted LPLAT superfamily acyltransferase